MARRLLSLLSVSPIFDRLQALERALEFHAERHDLLASNIANVDTPGFRPLELVRENPGNACSPLALRAVEGGVATHSAGESPAPIATVREDASAAPGVDGNAVSLEREMAKLAANDLRFQGAARFVTRQLALLRYAASDAMGG